jgi:hypothetical protein
MGDEEKGPQPASLRDLEGEALYTAIRPYIKFASLSGMALGLTMTSDLGYCRTALTSAMEDAVAAAFREADASAGASAARTRTECFRKIAGLSERISQLEQENTNLKMCLATRGAFLNPRMVAAVVKPQDAQAVLRQVGEARTKALDLSDALLGLEKRVADINLREIIDVTPPVQYGGARTSVRPGEE